MDLSHFLKVRDGQIVKFHEDTSEEGYIMGALECEKAAQNVGILWIIVIDFVRFESFRKRDHEFENLRWCWIFAPSRIKNEYLWVCFHT